MANAPRRPADLDPPIRLAVCVSGEGTTLQNLIDRIRSGKLRAEIVQVVASRPRIGAIARAEAAGIPAGTGQAQRAVTISEFSSSVFDPIRHSQADLVILGGFLSLLQIPPDYKGRVINVHPSLIPVVLRQGLLTAPRSTRRLSPSGVKVSGCTVHFVDDSYDNGPISRSADGAGPRRRHGRDTGRAGLQGRVQRTARGDHALRRGPTQIDGRRVHVTPPRLRLAMRGQSSNWSSPLSPIGSRLANGSAWRTPANCPQYRVRSQTESITPGRPSGWLSTSCDRYAA